MASPLTVYSDTSDGLLTSQVVNGDYATARSGGAGATLVATSSDTWAYIGQYRSGSTRRYDEIFLNFDTSNIPDAATITSATLSLYGGTGNSGGVLQARTRDWGDTLETSDWVPGLDLGALTLLGSFDMVTFPTTQYTSLASEAAFLTAINKTGKTRMIIATDLLAGSADMVQTFRSGFYLADNGSNQPKLVVEYTEGGGGGGTCPLSLLRTQFFPPRGVIAHG